MIRQAVARAGRGTRITVSALAVLGGLLAAGLLWAPAASAHAVLVSSSPVDGSQVNTEPAEVRLTFDESVGLIPSAAEVISTTGLRADTGHPSQAAGGTTIVMPLRPGLPKGTYSATWRVVSADTHVVSGSITFGLGVEPGAGVAAGADLTRGLDVAADIADGLVYLGVVLFAGVLAVTRALWPWCRDQRRVRLLALAGWGALAAGTLADLLLQGPRAANGGWPGVLRLQDSALTAQSVYGIELLTRMALLFLIAPLVTSLGWRGAAGRARDAAGAIAGLALLLSVAITGHAAVGADAWLAIPATMLHLAAMALWLGGLVTLWLIVLPALRAGQRTLAEARMRAWSLVAYSCVVCLVVTGEYQAARQVSPIQSLWTTSYGLTVLIKSGIVIVMVAAGGLAHNRIASPRAGEGSPAGMARVVRRSVRTETALGVAVLAVTAILTSEAPARTTYGPPAALTAPLGPDQVKIQVSTTRRGPQDITIRVVGPAGAAVAAQSVTATLSSPSVSSLNVALRKTAAGGPAWTAKGAVAPLPGLWTLTVNVSLNAGTAYTTSAVYQVW